MINNDKWINSLPNKNIKREEEIFQIDHNKWVNTIPKKNTLNSVKKYSFMTIIFIFGLFIVSIVKNQTRNLEKEISYLNASITSIEFNLKQAILDNEVITSPENISKLAKEYLNNDLIHYKKSQIKYLDDDNEITKELNKQSNEKVLNILQKKVKKRVEKKIKKKKEELAKLQELYNDPKSIPDEVKTKVAKQIKEKKFELKSLYESPKEVITIKRLGKWGAAQVIKVALGMPVIPGR
tara:strand:+ start:244 stop:957 length:714 start_codon:yes stop_codon:yes gene_type:complete